MKILDELFGRPVQDMLAIPGVIGAWLVGVLPTVALTLTVIYTALRIWESQTVQSTVNRWRGKR